MRLLLKLNLLSAVFAFPLFVYFELLGNAYRINRVSGWEWDRINRVTTVYSIAAFILSTFLFIYIVRRWMRGRKARFWSIPASIFYLFLFILIFRSLFPITHPADTPNPASGLIMIGLSILFPLYILVINLFGISENKTDQNKTIMK